MITMHHQIFGSNSGRIFPVDFDADYVRNVLRYAERNNIPLPSDNFLIVQDNLIKELKRIGVYQKADTLGIFATNSFANPEFALIDWKIENNKYVNYSLSYQPKGFKGDGSAKYIDTKFNPALMSVNYTLNSASRMSYLYSVPTSPTISNSSIDGINANASGGEGWFVYNGNAHRINTATNAVSPNLAFLGTGLKVLSRLDNTSVKGWNNGTITTGTQNSASLSNGNALLLDRGGRFSENGISLYYIGGLLTDSEAAQCKIVFETYLNQIESL